MVSAALAVAEVDLAAVVDLAVVASLALVRGLPAEAEALVYLSRLQALPWLVDLLRRVRLKLIPRLPLQVWVFREETAEEILLEPRQ